MSQFVLSPVACRLFPAGRSLSHQAAANAIPVVHSGQLAKTCAVRYGCWGSAASALKTRTWCAAPQACNLHASVLLRVVPLRTLLSLMSLNEK